MELDIDVLAKAISKANEGKPAYIFQYEDGTYIGVTKLKVKTRKAAIRLTTPTPKCYADWNVKAIKVKS